MGGLDFVIVARRGGIINGRAEHNVGTYGVHHLLGTRGVRNEQRADICKKQRTAGLIKLES